MSKKKQPLSLRSRGVNAATPEPEASTPAPAPTPAPVTNNPPRKASPKKRSVSKKKGVIEAKVIRDTFSLPANDYALIDELRTRCAKAGVLMNKSEIVRAGLLALDQMKSDQLSSAAQAVERVKTGRPKGR